MIYVFFQSTLPNFKQNEFSVVRQHEEFIWLHDSFVENEEYAGYIVSPVKCFAYYSISLVMKRIACLLIAITDQLFAIMLVM